MYEYNSKEKTINEESKKSKIKGIANNEILYSYNLKHKNLIKMYGYYTMDKSFGLVLEYAGGKDLNHFQALFKKNLIFKRNNINELDSQGRYLDWKLNYLGEYVLKFFFIQMIEALKYLKHMNVVHRDLKLENVFLMRNFQVKKGDLAFAKTVKPNEMVKASGSGTLVYMSPELFSNKVLNAENSFKQDYFALGIMLIKLSTFEFPLDKSVSDDKSKLSYDIVKNSVNEQKLKNLLIKHRGENKEFIKLILGLLDPDENTRFNINDILKNNWVSKEDKKRIKGIY